jgi:prepilin-type N-terminal cleavage/methylation domain-containing protein
MSIQNMLKRIYSKNQKGFTLLEMMSVLVIMGVMLSVAIKKYDLLSDTAITTALKSGIRELNTRETLVWTRTKLSDSGWTDDAEVFDEVDKKLGPGYSWDTGEPDITGGTLYYKSQPVVLTRTESTENSVGIWKKN